MLSAHNTFGTWQTPSKKPTGYESYSGTTPGNLTLFYPKEETMRNRTEQFIFRWANEGEYSMADLRDVMFKWYTQGWQDARNSTERAGREGDGPTLPTESDLEESP